MDEKDVDLNRRILAMDKVKCIADDLKKYILLIGFELTDKSWTENKELISAHEKIEESINIIEKFIYKLS